MTLGSCTHRPPSTQNSRIPLPPVLGFKAPSPIQQRLIDTAALQAEQPNLQTILYQHTVFCQTSLPYRDPGDEIRTWERSNGDVQMKVLAGEAMHPTLGCFVPLKPKPIPS
jgi:hypothetical protein